MFKISEETKAEAVDALREIFGKYGATDEELEKAFEDAVAIVKKQFGM
jgi:hypothetical protein